MPVPYIFANTPGGASIPLSELDDNFAYVLANTTGPTGPTGPTGAPSTVTGPTGYTGPTGAVASLVTAADVAALRALAVSTSYNVLLNGYYANGDGGGGQFYGVTGAAAGTYVENGGTVILPTGGNGSSAWLRIIDGPINIRWFGATGDGVTDDYTAIQAAINYAQVATITLTSAALSKPAVYIPVGIFNYATSLLISSELGIEVFGETRSVYEQGSVLRYTGSDYAIKIQNGVTTSSSSVTIGTGSKTFVTTNSSATSSIAVGDPILIRSTANEANFMSGTVTSFSGNTLVANIANTGGSGTASFWTLSDSYKFIYRNYLHNFGISLPNACNGGIYGWNIQESNFFRLMIIGTGPFSIHPNYTSQYGMRFDSISISMISDCTIQLHQNAIYIPHAPYNMQESGSTSIRDMNICGVRNGIVLAHFGGLIENNWMELFEAGILISNSALVSGVSIYGLDITNCTFVNAGASVNSSAISIVDVNTAKGMYVDSLQITNCSFVSNVAGSLPPYAIDFNLDPSNGVLRFNATVANNYCHGPTVAFMRCDASQSTLYQYQNVAYTDSTLSTTLPLLSSTSYALSGTYLLARDTQSGAYAPNNTSENVILSIPIPPNLIGPSGTIKVTAQWGVPNNANNKTLRMRINGIAGTIICENILSTGNTGCTFNTQMTNDTAATAQNSISWIFVRAASPSLANYNAYSTADTTALTTLDFTVQKAVSTDAVLVYAWLIEAYPN